MAEHAREAAPGMPAGDREAGHRLVAHAADVILEAWACSRVECLREAVLALVESFADPTGVIPTEEIAVTIDGTSDEDVLVDLLEEVLFVLDARGMLPVGVCLEEGDGVVTGLLATVPADEVEVEGAVPKGVSRSGLEFEPRDGIWWCRVLVDV